jgi:hypothetical protein
VARSIHKSTSGTGNALGQRRITNSSITLGCPQASSSLCNDDARSHPHEVAWQWWGGLSPAVS